MLSYLKKSLYLLLLLVTTNVWAGDDHHFIYIQSEKGELFYVRYNGKVLSASSKGYVIVPEIPKGTAQIIVGFPKNEIPEKQFLINLTGTRDEGFVIKHTGGQEIALFNLQTYTLLKPSVAETAVAAAETPASTEPAKATMPTATEPAATTPAENTTAATPKETVAQATAPAIDSTSAMMGNVKHDLDSAFANKQDIAVSGGPDKASVATTAPVTTAPVVATPATPAVPKQPSKFASALDKVVSDDRPADVPEEEKPVTAPAATTATVATPEEAVAVKKGKKKKVETNDPLTADEKALLADVMAEEQKTAAASEAAAPQEVVKPATETTTVPATTTPAETTTPAATPAPETVTTTPAVAPAETPASTEEQPLAKKEKKKKKHTTGDEPQFIDFNTGAAPAAVATTAAATTADVVTSVPAADTKASRKKKKQRDADEITSAPIAVDSSATVAAPVEVTKPSRKKKKHAEDATSADSSALKSDEWVTVNKTSTAPATTGAATATTETKPAVKDAEHPVLNSDCQQMLNGEGFKKLVKRMSAQGNESGMVETFNKNVRNTCLSVDQIRALAQMIDTDDYRYKMLEIAYQHTYETGNFPALQELLKDDYFKKRFKAMLR